jgi:MoaA/NifB/PqqE/SkfB family radical SAM enzyme
MYSLLNKAIMKTLRHLPKNLRKALTLGITSYRIKKARRLRTPTSIVFFITNKCNARCRHCFYWKELNKNEKEMEVKDIKKIANSLKDSYGLVITGGEPFLRKDIYEICKSFENKIKTLRIATNGLMTNTIYETVKKITTTLNFNHVDIQISLDGAKEVHNSIRGVKGSFDSAIKTIKKLKSLNKKNLDIQIITAINKRNHTKLKEFINDIAHLKSQIFFVITRSSSFGVFNVPKQISSEIDTKEKGITNLSTKDLKNIFAEIRAINNISSFKFWPIENQLYLKHSIELLEKRRKALECYAGSVDAVIYPGGNMALCELTKSIGNLKDYNFNLYNLWHSEETNRMRKAIKRCDCFCIHSCNLATSISLSKDMLLNF